MTLIQVLRWVFFIALGVQVVGIVYGLILLARIKREQRNLTDTLTLFSERSEKIAAAIITLRGSGSHDDNQGAPR